MLAVALAVVLSHLLLDGSAMDLGLSVVVVAPATLAIAVGLGLWFRRTARPWVSWLGLAALVPLRGPLAAWVAAAVPGAWSPLAAVLLTLGPTGLFLGRILSGLTRSSAVMLALGWALGELAVMAGAVSVLPGMFTGLAFAAAFAGLGRLKAEPSPVDGPGGHAEPAERSAWEAAPLGFAMGLVWLALQRVVPGYSTPPIHFGSEVSLALVLPAIVVAWPASVLAAGSAGRRLLLMVGFVAIGYALWKLSASLDLYKFSAPYVAVQTEIRQTATRWGAPVTEWRGWLLMFSALPAAGIGVVLGCLGRTACAPFALGLGVAFVAGSWVLEQPAHGPQQLLISAAGVAALGALSGWRRWALVACPLGICAAVFIPEQQVATYEGIRRVGEPGVESSERQLAADVMVFSSAGPDISAQQARRTYSTTFTDRVPLGEVRELLGEAWAKGHDHGADPLPTPLLAPLDDEDDEADRPLQKHFGLRFAGTPAHPAHDPLGAEGSLGRLHRLFGVRGRCLATGVGAEFVGADLLDAGIATTVDVSTALPMGVRNQRVLFALMGSAGLGLDVDDDPLRQARGALEGSYSMVVISPEHSAWPGAGLASTEESLARASELLAPGGRCLLWLDTGSLDQRALQSRVAAFGAVFGEQSAAFLEMREQSPPYLLLLGWVDESGRPRAEELLERIPGPDTTGLRTRLWSLDDLGAMLLLDGRGVAEVATSSPAHRRSSPRWSSSFTATGWSAIRGLLRGSRQLGTVIPGSKVDESGLTDVVDGLIAHGRYTYDLEPLGGAMLVEVVDDVDWDAFDREVAHYVRAAESDPDDPLLLHALAGLLGPLARVGDATRFAKVFEATGAEQMRSWRLAALEAHVRRAGLQNLEADEALGRAAQWATWAEVDADHH